MSNMRELEDKIISLKEKIFLSGSSRDNYVELIDLYKKNYYVIKKSLIKKLFIEIFLLSVFVVFIFISFSVGYLIYTEFKHVLVIVFLLALFFYLAKMLYDFIEEYYRITSKKLSFEKINDNFFPLIIFLKYFSGTDFKVEENTDSCRRRNDFISTYSINSICNENNIKDEKYERNILGSYILKNDEDEIDVIFFSEKTHTCLSHTRAYTIKVQTGDGNASERDETKYETEYFWRENYITAIRVYFSLNQIDLYSRIMQKKCFNIFKEVKYIVISSPDMFYPMNDYFFDFHQNIANYSIYNYKKISSSNDEVYDFMEGIQSFFLILSLLFENEFTVIYCKGIVANFWEIRKDSVYASSRSLEHLAREAGLITKK